MLTRLWRLWKLNVESWIWITVALPATTKWLTSKDDLSDILIIVYIQRWKVGAYKWSASRMGRSMRVWLIFIVLRYNFPFPFCSRNIFDLFVCWLSLFWNSISRFHFIEETFLFHLSSLGPEQVLDIDLLRGFSTAKLSYAIKVILALSWS